MRNVDTLPTNTYLMFDSPRSPHTTRFGSNGSISSCSSVSAMRPACTDTSTEGMSGFWRAAANTSARSASMRFLPSAHSASKSTPEAS